MTTSSAAAVDSVASLVDEDGYLLQPEVWTEDVARFLAEDTALGGLREEHWTLIHYLRRHYLKFGTLPPMRKLCRDSGFTSGQISRLFPTGLAKAACKIAGIPNLPFLLHHFNTW